MRATIQHVDGNPNKPLALHVNGELVPGQTDLDITSRHDNLTEVVIRFDIYSHGLEIVGVKPA